MMRLACATLIGLVMLVGGHSLGLLVPKYYVLDDDWGRPVCGFSACMNLCSLLKDDVDVGFFRSLAASTRGVTLNDCKECLSRAGVDCSVIQFSNASCLPRDVPALAIVRTARVRKFLRGTAYHAVVVQREREQWLIVDGNKSFVCSEAFLDAVCIGAALVPLD